LRTKPRAALWTAAIVMSLLPLEVDLAGRQAGRPAPQAGISLAPSVVSVAGLRPPVRRVAEIASGPAPRATVETVSRNTPSKVNEAATAPVAPPASPGAAFTIQVAASANARHARAMVDELKRAGHEAYLVEQAALKGGPYQVRVGRYSTLSEANRSASGLEKTLGWRLSITTVAQGSYAREDTRLPSQASPEFAASLARPRAPSRSRRQSPATTVRAAVRNRVRPAEHDSRHW